jgi:antitoxin component of MazEF toxin-antitoxin module
MPTKLCRWGNSLGLRVSSYIVDCAHWKAGDSMEVRLLENGDVLVRPVKPRNGGGRIAAENSPAEARPVEKEVW